MRYILVLVSAFVLAVSGGETPRTEKLFKAFDAGPVLSLEASERGQEPDKFLASTTTFTEASSGPATPSSTTRDLLISATQSKPYARAPPAAA